MRISENWSYDRSKRISADGTQWHFVTHDFPYDDIDYDEAGFEIYFRDEHRSVYGVVKFERRKDFPYSNYEKFVEKIMNNKDYREQYLASDSSTVWLKSWK